MGQKLGSATLFKGRPDYLIAGKPDPESHAIFKLASFQSVIKKVQWKLYRLKICANKVCWGQKEILGFTVGPSRKKDHQEQGLMNHSFQSEGNVPLSQNTAGGDD